MGFGFSVLGVITLVLVVSDQIIYVMSNCGSNTACLVDI